MKFPVAFRIFATLNLILFVILFILSIFLFMKVVGGIWFLSAVALAEIWLLVSSMLWFFGSKRSYSLIFITAISLLLLAVGFISLTRSDSISSSDKIGFLICGAFSFIYVLFLFGSLSFKPIREWRQGESSKIADPVLAIFFGVLLITGIGSSYYIENVKKDYIIIESARGLINISSSEAIFDVEFLMESDAIVASFKGDPSRQYEGTIYFSETYAPESDTAFQVAHSVVFKPFMPSDLRAGESIDPADPSLPLFIAEFPTTAARRILIQTLAGIPAMEKSSYTLVHSVRVFDKKTTRDMFVFAEEEFDDAPEYDGYSDQPTDDHVMLGEYDKETPLTITPQLANTLINQFAKDILTNENAQYYFNRNQPSLEINNSRIGHYLHFRSLLDFVPATLNQFLFDNSYEEALVDYNLTSGTWKLTGLNFTDKEDEGPPYFSYINTRLVQWARLNLMPKPEDKILDRTAQEVYEQVFRHMLWQLAAAHEYLNNKEEYFATEANQYRTAMDAENFNGVEYLYDKYRTVDSKAEPFNKVNETMPPEESDYYYLSEPVAIGFWLRRKLDGSDKEMWALVEQILKTYDNYPVGESTQNHSSQ